MRVLNKPNIDVERVVEDCSSNLREGSEKYLGAIPQIVEYSNKFDEGMCNTTAWELIPHDVVTQSLTKKDMVDLYINKFSKKGQPGRKYYDQIIIAPRFGVCPICGIGDVATLDHYMAKSVYPTLAVTPTNLVPACRDCNSIRKTQLFSSVSDLTLHPYYDDVRDIEWLEAKIISLAPVSVEYCVSDTFVEEPMRSRLEKHLEIFELKRRFALKAAEELSSIKHSMQIVLDNGGEAALHNFLQVQCTIATNNERNSYKSALYRALVHAEQLIVDGQIV